MKTVKTKNYTVKFSDNEGVKDKVFKRLIAFYLHHEAFSGEQIQQSDEPVIDAPTLLSEIADDIIKFDVEYTD